MPRVRDGLERLNNSEAVTVLWVTRPGLAVTILVAMATPPLLRAMLEALGLR